ncbi:MAG TPA: lytic transglycosylase domain-containing protein [Caulobacteraceae bacterium]
MRRVLGTAATAALAGAALSASAAPIQALSPHDLSLYAAAFDAAEHGDNAAADAALAEVSDPCLAGKVQYQELVRGKARTASYDDLAGWLKAYGDVPGAGQIYEMALRKMPADAPPPPPVKSIAGASDGVFHLSPAPQSHAAREAYFSGDISRALNIARASRDAWIAGLAAYRLGEFGDAMISFESLAANPSEDDATRAAGGVWAAKAAELAGMPERVTPLLKIAAAASDNFYGMVARRKLQLADDPVGRMLEAVQTGAGPTATPASFTTGHVETALERLVRTDARARRAVALTQLGRVIDAGGELRAGYAAADDDTTRALWMGLMFELSPDHAGGEVVLHAATPLAYHHALYPTPNLTPEGGFTIDRALVYAVTWQESRFNSLAVSPVGAVGLMQLMPPTAARTAGEPELTSDPITLFDTGKNLALGQAYITWLENNSADHDILRTIAAYNAGPTALTRVLNAMGGDADSLLVMESMPAPETRAYVKKVMTAYWTYRRQFGAPTKTLDAVAADMPVIDARLDKPMAPPEAKTDAGQAREALEILLGHAG